MTAKVDTLPGDSRSIEGLDVDALREARKPREEAEGATALAKLSCQL